MSNDYANFFYYLCFLILLITVVKHSNYYKSVKLLKYLGLWFGIFAILIILYSFKDKLLNNNIIANIKSSYGVSHIVTFSETFASIPNNIIEQIQDKLDERSIYREDASIVDYQKGDQVLIKGGSFAGIDAMFLSNKSQDRVRLLLNLLNTSVVAEIATSNIENKEVVRNFKL